MIDITYIDENGDEVSTSLPSKKIVCTRCDGHGTHLNPSIGSHAYSAEEFDEAFEPGSEEREHYFRRGGMYDVSCEECKGKNVVDVVDEDSCKSAEDKAHLAAYNKHQTYIAACEA